jgi:deoxyribonuclease V
MPAVRRLHEWNVSPTEAVELQRRLAGDLTFALPDGWSPRVVAGVDVTSDPADADAFTAGIVVLRLPEREVIEEVTAAHPAGFPYIPGLLTFREGPAILAAVAALRSQPDAWIFDGAGYAHPRRLGLASHLGLWLDAPAVGCAKTWLIGDHVEPGPARGDFAPLVHKGEEIGRVLRTRDAVHPVFLSAGHRMTLSAACDLVLACCRYRVPEPTRLAHLLVNRAVGRLPAKGGT